MPAGYYSCCGTPSHLRMMGCYTVSARYYSHRETAFHLRTSSCYITSACCPVPTARDSTGVVFCRKSSSVSSGTTSCPSTNFDTSPFPWCTFRQVFSKMLGCPQPFDTPSSPLSIISQISTASTSAVLCPQWMASSLTPFRSVFWATSYLRGV